MLQVFWTGFSKDGNSLFTVSNTAIRKWQAKELELKISQEYTGFYRSKGYISEDEEWVYASGRMGVTRFSFEDLSPCGSALQGKQIIDIWVPNQ